MTYIVVKRVGFDGPEKLRMSSNEEDSLATLLPEIAAFPGVAWVLVDETDPRYSLVLGVSGAFHANEVIPGILGYVLYRLSCVRSIDNIKIAAPSPQWEDGARRCAKKLAVKDFKKEIRKQKKRKKKLKKGLNKTLENIERLTAEISNLNRQ